MTRTFTEPTLDDLLTDPLVQMVMRADGLNRVFVRDLGRKLINIATMAAEMAK